MATSKLLCKSKGNKLFFHEYATANWMLKLEAPYEKESKKTMDTIETKL
jgi:hypothetical protein